MRWLRSLGYLLPVLVGFAAILLGREVRDLEMPSPGGALTTSIREPIGPLHPFAALDGVTREIRDLVFEPLLVRDADFEIAPNLIESWSYQTIVTFHGASEESAGEIEARIRSREFLPEGLEVRLLEREGSLLTLVFDGDAPEVEGEFLPLVESGLLADFDVVELTVDHSVEQAVDAYLDTAVEKASIRILDFEGDRVARLFIGEDLDRFLREFELYLESNPAISPRVEQIEARSEFVSREMQVVLREGLRWHDGEPVTSEDLLFSFDLLTRRDPASPLYGLFWFAESAETRGDREVRLICRETPTIALECWERLPLLPAHRFSGGFTAESWNRFLSRPVGCGPYRLERRFPDGGVELSANPGYFRGAPAEGRLLYREFESLESKLLALRSSRVDALVPDRRFASWSRRNPGQVIEERGASRFQHLVAWNLDRAPFSDPRFRRALAHAISVPNLLEDGEVEFRQPVHGLFPVAAPWAPESFEVPEFAPRRAELLLEELDYRFDEESGRFVDTDGEPLSFRLAANRENPTHRQWAEALSQQWAELGITVEVELSELPVILAERILPREFDGVLLSWEIPTGRDRHALFHSEGAPAGRGNLFGLRDGEVDLAAEDLRASMGREDIAGAASRLQERVAELQPGLFLAETGRIHWLRSGAISLEWGEGAPEAKQPEEPVDPTGFDRRRMWWVKQAGETGGIDP